MGGAICPNVVSRVVTDRRVCAALEAAAAIAADRQKPADKQKPTYRQNPATPERGGCKVFRAAWKEEGCDGTVQAADVLAEAWEARGAVDTALLGALPETFVDEWLQGLLARNQHAHASLVPTGVPHFIFSCPAPALCRRSILVCLVIYDSG